MNADALITAINATLEIGSNATPKIRLKLHPDTGLLLAAGTEQQVEIVEQVVSQLTGPRKVVDSRLEELSVQIESLRKELKQLRRDLGKGDGAGTEVNAK